LQVLLRELVLRGRGILLVGFSFKVFLQVLLKELVFRGRESSGLFGRAHVF
jgi:hypothetical protein